jgi:hypothetical protein
MKPSRRQAFAMTSTRFFTSALAAAFLWTGCAVTPPPTPKGDGKSGSVRVDEGAKELEALRSGLKTREDSLALDLLKGFRALRLAQGSETADADAVGKGRQAYDELEAKLRKGGLKSKASSERVYSIGDRDNLTLQEVLTAANKSAQKLLLDGELAKSKERNREIVINRPTLSFAVEDAQWGLALADALEAPGIPESIKRKLRALHESYYHEAPQDEIVKQVNVLLAEVADEKLRQHLKKLANRAWERDRRANRLPQGSKKAAVQDTAPAATPSQGTAHDATTSDASKVDPSKNATQGGNPANTQGDAKDSAKPVASYSETSPIDSLIGAGKYVQALRGLEALDANSHADFIRERRMRAGERFCDDRRRSAAESYKKARSAASEALKSQLLRQTAADLDSCLFYFPETSVGAKVRRNREMVEDELKKLKK